MTSAPEGFRPIPSCPGYSASRHGEIYSKHSARRLFGGRDRYGYLNVNLSVAGKMVRRKVHRLICEAFYGHPPSPKHHAAHLDGDRTNNRLENLVWATPGENERHKIAHGTSNLVPGVGFRMPGTSNPNAKLTEDQVAEIKAAAGSVRQIGARYGVSAATVSRVKNGIAYGDEPQRPNEVPQP